VSKSYPKHKFALEVNVRGYKFARLFNEHWVAKKVFDSIKPTGDVLEVAMWHDYKRIYLKREDFLDRSHK
jgi:hypothetical protein